PPDPRRRRREGFNPELSHPEAAERRTLARRWRTVPALANNDDPLAWKERHFGPRLWPSPDSAAAGLLFAALIVGGSLLAILLISITVGELSKRQPVGEIYGPIARVIFTVLLPLIVLGVGVIVSGS